MESIPNCLCYIPFISPVLTYAHHRNYDVEQVQNMSEDERKELLFQIEANQVGNALTVIIFLTMCLAAHILSAFVYLLTGPFAAYSFYQCSHLQRHKERVVTELYRSSVGS